MATNLFTSSSTGLTYLPPTTTTKEPKQAEALKVIAVDSVTNKVRMRLGDTPTKVRDEAVLLDKVTLALMTTLGSNDFDPNMGSFLTIIQRSSSADVTTLKAKVILALNVIKQKVLTEQKGRALSADQRLYDLILSNIYLDPYDPTSLLIEVLVATESNASYILTV